jgi:hypothetical protein
MHPGHGERQGRRAVKRKGEGAREVRPVLDRTPQLIRYIQTNTAIVTSTTAPYAMRTIRSTAMAWPWQVRLRRISPMTPPRTSPSGKARASHRHKSAVGNRASVPAKPARRRLPRPELLRYRPGHNSPAVDPEPDGFDFPDLVLDLLANGGRADVRAMAASYSESISFTAMPSRTHQARFWTCLVGIGQADLWAPDQSGNRWSAVTVKTTNPTTHCRSPGGSDM